MAGKVVNIKPYGVFVDLDGATGLLHIKEISTARVESLNTLFEVGQEIKVVIKQIDEYQNRMSLSIQALESYPGENIEKLEQVMANAEERWSKHQSNSDAAKTSKSAAKVSQDTPSDRDSTSEEPSSESDKPEAN